MKTAPMIVTAVLLTLAMGKAADAHKKQVPQVRELVRIQGYRGSQPLDVPVARNVDLLALGRLHPFQVTKWRRFGLSDGTEALPEEVATRFTLQGERSTLRRFGAARPDQLVTILAERRPGSRDLFIVELDLCPAK